MGFIIKLTGGLLWLIGNLGLLGLWMATFAWLGAGDPRGYVLFTICLLYAGLRWVWPIYLRRII